MSNLIKHVIDKDLINETFEGTILWYRERDGFGIIILENNGSEIFFDSSVVKGFTPKKRQRVSFNFNTKIKECACAKNVSLKAA